MFSKKLLEYTPCARSIFIEVELLNIFFLIWTRPLIGALKSWTLNYHNTHTHTDRIKENLLNKYRHTLLIIGFCTFSKTRKLYSITFFKMNKILELIGSLVSLANILSSMNMY